MTWDNFPDIKYRVSEKKSEFIIFFSIKLVVLNRVINYCDTSNKLL